MNWYPFRFKKNIKGCWLPAAAFNTMRPLLAFFFIFLSCASLHAQETSVTYLNTSDSTGNYYITHTPDSEIKGLLLLLPGFGEAPFSADAETKIPEAAAKKGLLTIVASLPEGPYSFYVDEESQAALDQLIAHLYKRFPLKGKKFYMGGFSLGGSGVVKYAERAAATKQLHRPDAIFAIDPPLDLERLYRTQQKDIARNYSPLAVQEASYFLNRIEEEVGASPDQNQTLYHQLSPFSLSDSRQRASKLLQNQPILLISEPALEWQQKERGRSYQELNAYVCENLITTLKKMGNQDAFLRQTEGKGYRKGKGEYHPHSWSIAEPSFVLDWLQKF